MKINNNFFNNILILFFSFIALFIYTHKSIKSATILEIKDEDFVIGNVDAPVTIIEYASLSCSHCANFHKKTLPIIIKDYVNNSKVKIVFRDFPLNYPALMGSMLLQCIDKNIRYEYLTALFELQSNWVKADVEVAKNELFKIMQAGGMTEEKFNKCLNNQSIEQKILKNLMDAQNEFNIGTTPSFLINGTLLEGNKSIKDIKKIIDKKLNNQ